MCYTHNWGGGYKSFDDIDFGKLPKQFVIKTNHGSGNCIFVKNKFLFLHSGLRIVAREYIKHWMQLDYGYDDGFEMHYSGIEPYVFIEEYVPALHEDLHEYRFMCFEGKPQFVELKTGKQGEFRNIYDINWNKRDVEWGHSQNKDFPKPDVFEEMLTIATKLSKDFHFVRVDLNYTNGYIYFGEMTFTSGSGFIRIRPKEFDNLLGNLISTN